MPEVDTALLVQILGAIETYVFEAHLNIGRLQKRQFLKWIMSANTVATKKIAVVITAKKNTCSKHSKPTMFASFLAINLQETGAEQVRPVLQASLAVPMYAEKDPRARELFYTLSLVRQSSVAVINLSPIVTVSYKEIELF